MNLRVKRAHDQAIVATHVKIADSFFSRLKGLMFVPSISEGAGLLITPCTSIHMMFMRFSIDAVFLDASNRVVACYHALRPWVGLSSRHPKAAKVLELPAGTLKKFEISLEESFIFEETNS